jgi:hypothetical protein
MLAAAAGAVTAIREVAEATTAAETWRAKDVLVMGCVSCRAAPSDDEEY